jgi:hypothetical protein
MYPCINPTPVLVQGTDTGFVQCDSGFVHRAVVHACPSSLPRAGVCGQPSPFPGPDGGPAGCTTDSACTAQPNGFCSQFDPTGGFPVGGCTCYYGCKTDADCGAGQMCLCGDPVGVCVPASCKSDADCGPGLLCTMSAPLGTCPSAPPFACQSPADSCGGSKDCPQTSGASVCGYANGLHQCVSECAFGRPFLVRGTAQTAGTERRADWQARVLEPSVDGLSVSQREALAGAWARMAAMEHASIAAFARFALQLLSVGAPASLLEQTQDAMRDETWHARMCFAMASRYAGFPVGPSALSVRGALADSDPESILTTTILEGCIGETVAAIEAAEALEHARDPAVRAVLAKIAEDETRHAELAWRFVRWATAQDEALRALASRTFAAEVEGARPSPRAPDEESTESLLAFGVVPERLRREIRSRVLREVIAPCAAALLEDATRGARPLRCERPAP